MNYYLITILRSMFTKRLKGVNVNLSFNLNSVHAINFVCRQKQVLFFPNVKMILFLNFTTEHNRSLFDLLQQEWVVFEKQVVISDWNWHMFGLTQYSKFI